jgi:response regulator NasT
MEPDQSSLQSYRSVSDSISTNRFGDVKSSLRSNHPEVERQYGLLLVSASEHFNRSFLEVLDPDVYSPVICLNSVADAKRRFLERNYDLVIVNSPLPDEFGLEFACDVCSEGCACSLIFVRSELFADVNHKAVRRGVLALSKPSSSSLIQQTLGVLCGINERLRRMEQKTVVAEEKIREIRLVNRAKLLLVEQLKMTEAEAHRYIEKQAMDNCVTRRIIAERIIATRES